MNKKTFILLLFTLIHVGLLRAQTSVEFILTEDGKPVQNKEKLELFLFQDNRLSQLQFANNYLKADPFKDSAQICVTLPELKIIIPIYYSYQMLVDLKTLTVDLWSDNRRKKEKQYKGDKRVYTVTEDMRGDREGISTIIEEKK
ncbi:MAG: hypothetical protein ACXVPN_04285 [Bacteroidia bacterium]